MLNHYAIYTWNWYYCMSAILSEKKKMVKWENRASGQWLIPSLRLRPKEMKQGADENPVCQTGKPDLAGEPVSALCPCLMGNMKREQNPDFLSVVAVCAQIPPSGAWRTGQDPMTTSFQSLDLGTGEYSDPKLPLGLNCPLYNSAFYSFLKMGGRQLGLKGKASLHVNLVQVWSNIPEYQVPRGLRPETWYVSSFTCIPRLLFALWEPYLGTSTITICLILLFDNDNNITIYNCNIT